MKISVSKEKIGCPCRRGHDFRILRSNFSAKTKNFAKAFLPVHMGARSNLLSKKNKFKKVPISNFTIEYLFFSDGWPRVLQTRGDTGVHQMSPSQASCPGRSQVKAHLSLSLSFSLSFSISISLPLFLYLFIYLSPSLSLPLSLFFSIPLSYSLSLPLSL